jgi:hypothetical protein
MFSDAELQIDWGVEKILSRIILHLDILQLIQLHNYVFEQQYSLIEFMKLERCVCSEWDKKSLLSLRFTSIPLIYQENLSLSLSLLQKKIFSFKNC